MAYKQSDSTRPKLNASDICLAAKFSIILVIVKSHILKFKNLKLTGSVNPRLFRCHANRCLVFLISNQNWRAYRTFWSWEGNREHGRKSWQLTACWDYDSRHLRTIFFSTTGDQQGSLLSVVRTL